MLGQWMVAQIVMPSFSCVHRSTSQAAISLLEANQRSVSPNHGLLSAASYKSRSCVLTEGVDCRLRNMACGRVATPHAVIKVRPK